MKLRLKLVMADWAHRYLLARDGESPFQYPFTPDSLDRMLERQVEDVDRSWPRLPTIFTS